MGVGFCFVCYFDVLYVFFIRGWCGGLVVEGVWD